MSGKVAIVTGSNKGIGFAIVRGLCKKFGGDVYLTSRDEGRGMAAVKELEKEGLKPKFHQLDIDNKESIAKLHDFVKAKYGGIDILVNNAAIAYKNADPTPFGKQASVTMKTNYFALLDVCDSLFPLLKEHSRVVHLASMAGQFAFNKSSDDKKKLAAGAKTIDEVTKFMEDFVKDAEAGNHTSKGWPNTAYGMTKLGVIMMTGIQQAAADRGNPGKDILINSCCPGYVDTDMSSHKGHLTIDQGAENPLYLALLPPNSKSPKGDFIREMKIVNWNKI